MTENRNAFLALLLRFVGGVVLSVLGLLALAWLLGPFKFLQ